MVYNCNEFDNCDLDASFHGTKRILGNPTLGMSIFPEILERENPTEMNFCIKKRSWFQLNAQDLSRSATRAEKREVHEREPHPEAAVSLRKMVTLVT